MQWKSRGKDRRVSPRSWAKNDARRFKKRSDLITFALEHPGAIAAHFAHRVWEQTGNGVMRRTGDMRKVPYVKYVQSDAFGLTELRDKREAVTLATVLEKINKNELEEAVDVLSSRLLALKEAKTKGGSWEQASKKELIAESAGTSLQMAGLSSLT